MRKRSEMIMRCSIRVATSIGEALGIMVFAFPIAFIVAVLVSEIINK